MARMLYSIQLLLAIGVAFILQLLIPPLTTALWLDPNTALAMPWTLVTSMFLHGSFLHLFLNAFALFSFGPYLETRIGSKRFLGLYFASGIAGAVAYLLVIALGIGQPLPALGASGAIFGVLGAVAVLEPNLPILLMFVPLPMWMAAILWVILELVGTFTPGTGIASAAHLGGLFLGAAYIYHLKHKGAEVEYLEGL